MGADMQRREFIGLIGDAIGGRWRRARKGERMRHVGVLLPAPTIPMRLFSAPLLGQALGARLLLVG
jgi:hypothetical protein